MTILKNTQVLGYWMDSFKIFSLYKIIRIILLSSPLWYRYLGYTDNTKYSQTHFDGKSQVFCLFPFQDKSCGYSWRVSGKDNFKLLQTRKYRCCFCFCPAGGGACWRCSSWPGCRQCPLSADMFVPGPSHLATQAPGSGCQTAASRTRISQFVLHN